VSLVLTVVVLTGAASGLPAATSLDIAPLGHLEIAEQRKIDELGGVPNLLNKRNPIGPRRFDLMGEGYSR
jgi:NADP-dependent 3-hydroxy acid dehydrogenase YdfG